MLINTDKAVMPERVKFVSYSGKYPNMCGGTLVLDIRGSRYSFNDRSGSVPFREKFWEPAGGNGGYWSHGEWAVNVALLPEELRDYDLAAEIDRVINANMEYGHCGGCA